MDDYYSRDELERMNFLHLGDGVKISKRTGIYIPEKVWVGNYVTVEAYTKISPNVQLKNNVNIGPFCALHGDKGICLGENTVLESHVCLYSSTSDYSGVYIATAMVKKLEYVGDLGKKINIGKNVRIGCHCCILPGTDIEDGIIVLEHSLIKGFLCDSGAYSGIPAVGRFNENSKS